MPKDIVQVMQQEYRTQDQEFAFFVGSMGMTVNAARRRAGISNDKAWELMRDEQVLNYIDMLREEHSQELEITKDDARRGILRAITQAHQQADPKTQIGGWAEINQMEGFRAPAKHQHDHSGTVEVEHTQKQIQESSNEELIRMIRDGDDDIEDADIVSEAPWAKSGGNTSGSTSVSTTGSGSSAGRSRQKTNRKTTTPTSQRGSASNAGSNARSNDS